MEVIGYLHAPTALTYGKDAHWIGSWVVSRAGVEVLEKKLSPPSGDLIPDRPICIPVDTPTTLIRFLGRNLFTSGLF
jgi:hypothetical protein